MAFYNVEITMGDGERETVRVEADNVAEARTKARAQAETGADIGLPVLEAPRRVPGAGRAAPPGAGDVGEEFGEGARAFEYQPPLTAPAAPAGPPMWLQDEGQFGPAAEFGQPPVVTVPPVGTFDDFTQTLDPDLFDPGSTTYVSPVAPVPLPIVPGFQDPGMMVLPGGAVAAGPEGFQDPGAGFQPGTGVAPPPPAANGAPVSRLETFGEAGAGGMVGGPSGPPGIVGEAGAAGAAAGGAGGVSAAGPYQHGFYDPELGYYNSQTERFQSTDPGAAATNGGVNGGFAATDPLGTPILTSREMIADPDLRRAGIRRALQNVFGQELGSGVGPVASWLQRQTDPRYGGNLLGAFRAGSLADMTRPPMMLPATAAGTVAAAPAGDIGGTDFAGERMDTYLADDAAAPVGAVTGMPGPSFEDFLRTTAAKPTGLGGAYTQALQNLGTLRGLQSDWIPTGQAAGASYFDPSTAAEAANAMGLLGAAQRGRYSGLVSSRFRRPSQDDLFADYFLAKQDAAAAGQSPQNFLNFAAQRYGL